MRESSFLPSGQRGKNYKEWLANKNATSWKAILKRSIDEAIQASGSYEDFLDLIRAKGYEIKGPGAAAKTCPISGSEENADQRLFFQIADRHQGR